MSSKYPETKVNVYKKLLNIKGTPLKSGCLTHVNLFFENRYFLVNNVLSVSKLILWYINMSSIDLATRFKIGMYLLKKETR